MPDHDKVRLNKPASRADFQLALICTLALEADAIEALFDHQWDCDTYSKTPGDPNAYSAGRIGDHDVVLAYMPGTGKANAAALATNCCFSFPNINMAIIFGICGVVPFLPGTRDEIILGDVVVSQGMVQYYLGRDLPDHFEYEHMLEESTGEPNNKIRALLAKLRAQKALEAGMKHYLDVLQNQPTLAAHYPSSQNDKLYKASYKHIDKGRTCQECGCNGELVPRKRLEEEEPRPKVHFGRTASSDKAVKSGEERDGIARELGVIAFETGASGWLDNFPCLVIKGACDYADGHQSKTAQRYAAATAASCTKAFLRHWTVSVNTDVVREWVPRFLVPFPVNESFVGRQSILQTLRQQLQPEKPQAVAALFGLSGIGKTQIALSYAYRTRAEHPNLSVFWVYASSANRIRQSYSSIAQACQIPGHDDPNTDILALVKQWLQVEHQKPWLMIVDGADDVGLFCDDEKIRKYLPACRQGMLLVTTTSHEVAIRVTKGQHFFEVDRFTDDEARSLLTPNFKGPLFEPSNLTNLASRLEYNPLALVQAAAFIHENKMPSSLYLALFLEHRRTGRIKLVDEDFETFEKSPETLQTVAEVWMLSFLHVKNTLAGELLSLMSVLDCHSIHESLLDDYMERKHKTRWPLQRIRAIDVLKNFSLVSVARDNSITVHRLVQVFIRRWLIQENKMVSYTRAALTTIWNMYYSQPSLPTWCSTTFLSHTVSVLQLQSMVAKVNYGELKARFLSRMTTRHLMDLGLGEAESFSLQNITVPQAWLEYEDETPLTSTKRLNKAYVSRESWQEMSAAYETTLTLVKSWLGDEHLEALNLMLKLGVAYLGQGSIEDAQNLFSQVCNTSLMVFGENSSTLLDSLRHQAATRNLQNQLPAAADFLEKAMVISWKVYGKVSLGTAVFQYELATVKFDLGLYEEAVALMGECINTLKVVLGPEDPVTARPAHRLEIWEEQLGGGWEISQETRNVLRSYHLLPSGMKSAEADLERLRERKRNSRNSH
ncbi:hypothetical protein FSARC_3656 [Fusarium sarcochroum]|uniref:Nucleoside phosphorylase domain-containing protein n=1 Tax=Fusarium sarcochroum TaxID=1208366 RepID=A0A8H4XBL0_9HYPO|nr:hypothetical protein FSARC_3656 [Fusarium sarcochroum]